MDTQKNVQIYKILKEKIRLYFQQKGIDPYANRSMRLKLLIFLVMMISGYVLLLTAGKTSGFLAFFSWLCFVLGATLLVVNVAHDASHRAFSASKSVNRLCSYSWNLLGISKNLWEIKHHHSHHIYTNIPHQDVDIAESPLLRFSVAYPFKWHYRFQHLYAPVLYLLFGIFIAYVKDFVMFFQLRNKAQYSRKLNGSFLLRLTLTKLVFLAVSFIIPLLVLPFEWWQSLFMYLACIAICGSLMLLVLVVPHINAEAELHGNTDDIHNQDAWALLQIHSTVDSSSESRLLNWLSGGLNTRLVKQTLQEQGFRYKEKSFVQSLVDHFKYLKQMGQKPADESLNLVRSTTA